MPAGTFLPPGIRQPPGRASDDEFFTLGTDEDIVLVLNSAANSANTGITDVLEGTPVTPALPVNSAILSNTTANGDILLAANTGSNSEAVFWVDASVGDTAVMAASSGSVDIYVAGTKEYDFSASSADFNANTIDDVGTISATNAAGPSVINLAATTTVPTLVPNRAEPDTGIGWASDTLHVVLGGANEYSFSTSTLDMNNNTLTNVGAPGNNWTAEKFSHSSALSGTLEMHIHNTGTNTTDHARFQISTGDGNFGDPYIMFDRAGSSAWTIGLDNSESDRFVISNGTLLGSNDAIQISDTTPPVVEYNTTHPTGVFDYVCGTCGRHEAESFTCCGLVEWHDDVMDFRAMAMRDDQGLDYMERVGVINRKTNNEGDPQTFTVLGRDFEFAMSAAFQNRQRMDAQHDATNERLSRIEAAIGG